MERRDDKVTGMEKEKRDGGVPEVERREEMVGYLGWKGGKRW